jgi:hypothetical protein
VSVGPGPPAGDPCPQATPALAASAATEAKNPFLIERSLAVLVRSGVGPGRVNP